MTTTAFDFIKGLVVPEPTASEEEKAAWLAERRNGIGASDAAAACGLDPYKTELQLYLEKRGELAPEDISDKPAVRMGNRLEQVVAEEYEEQTGRKLHRVNRMLQSRKHPFMRATLDRVPYGEKRIVECKTAGFWAAKQDSDWGPPGTDLVPLRYALQITHDFIVTEWELADLAVLVAGQETNIYNFTPNTELMALMVERETEFWRRVVEGDPPPVRTVEDGPLKFPKAIERAAYATQEIVELIGVMQDARRKIKELEEIEKTGKARVMEYMGDANILYFDNNEPLISWKNVSALDVDKLRAAQPGIAAQFTTKFDTTAFKKQYPALYKDFTDPSGGSRTFRFLKED